MLKELLNGGISQNDVLNYYNATIKYETLPKKIYGFVHKYKGINLIIINKSLSYYKRKKTILHELAHIELNHLYDDLFAFHVEEYEDEADKYIEFIKENIERRWKNE